MDEGNPAELSKVISAGDIQKVDALIRAGADVHYTREGYDALLDAVCRLNAVQDTQLLPLLRLLVQHNVALNTITRYQESALRVLSRLGRFDGIALLLSAGADASQLEWTPLARATAIGSIDDMQRCLANGSKLEDRDWWNRTPYLIAIKTGDIGKAKLLLAVGNSHSRTRLPTAIHLC